MEGVIRSAQAMFMPVLIAGLILYFSYHALAGDQGLTAWTRLQAQEAQIKSDIDRLRMEKLSLQASLARLRDKTLDLDYVEEIARTKLSFVRPDELLVAVR